MNNQIEIQQAIIAILLKYPEQYLAVAEALKVEMFDTNYQKLVSVLFDWCLEKDEISLPLFADATSVDVKFLRELFILPTQEGLREHVEALRKHYLRQVTQVELTSAIDKVGLDAEPTKALDELQERVSNEVSSITPLKDDHIALAAIDALEVFHKASESKSLTGEDTGYQDFNNLSGGWQSTDQIIVAARPGMGKTTLAANFILRLADRGIPTALFSLEMSKIQIVNLFASIITGISTEKIRSGRLSEEEKDALEACYHKIGEYPIYLYDSLFDIQGIVTKVAQVRRKFDVRIVFYDYIQLIDAITKYRDRHHQVEYVSRRLKQLAKKENITNIILAQLNRQVEARSDKTPMLSDLKESGAIEQDADMVIMLYRDSYYNQDEHNDQADLLIRKYRHGRTGVLRWRFKDRRFLESSEYLADPGVFKAELSNGQYKEDIPF